METRQAPRIPAWLLGVLGVAAAIALVLLFSWPLDSTPYWGLSGNRLDLNVYRWGGEYVRVGRELYGEDLHGLYPIDPPRGPMPFTYTPFAAVLFVPLTVLSVASMEYLWTTASLVSVFLVAYLTWRWLGHGATRRTVWAALACAVIFLYTEPMRMTLWLGQINMLLLLLLLWDAQRPPGARLRGVTTGLAAGIKLTPAFLWAHYLVTRQWRTAAVSVGTFVVTIAVGAVAAWSSSRDFWTGGLLKAGRIGLVDAPSNQSVNGLISWYFFDGRAPTTVWLALAVPTALVGLGAAALIHRRGLPQLAFCLSGMTGCMVPPFSWGHHWVWFLPLLVVLLDLLLRHARTGWARLNWLLVAALVFLVGAWPQDFADPAQPDGRWVGTGVFMWREAIEGPFKVLLHEPYVTVWAVTLVAGAVFAWRRPRPTVDA